MAKTLNQFLEGYLKVKNPDEQKFVDKHVVAKHSDRNGNDDEVFKGSKVKQIDRRKERHGYNPGEDEKVYEELKGNQHKIDANKNGKVDAHDFKLLRKKKKVAEEAEQIEESAKVAAHLIKRYGDNVRKSHVRSAANDFGVGYVALSHAVRKKLGVNRLEEEQIDELSKKTLAKYIPAAAKDAERAGAHQEYFGRDDDFRAGKNRQKGIERAVKKLAKEEAEQVDEKINMDKASMGTVIKDFQKSKAPQFKGKSQEKRRAMAIAAKLTAERGGKPLRKEEKLAELLGDLTESHRRTMLSVFDKLNEDNQKKFLEACGTPEGVEQMLDFSISHRGE